MKFYDNFTFFFGGPFSNFHESFFVDSNGTRYNCTEQYYMAHKALFFEDNANYLNIMRESTPKKQKYYGRRVVGFNSDSWYGDSSSNPAKKIMFDGNYLKYTQNKDLQEKLLRTEGTLLVEASPFDTIWGIGLSAENPIANDKSLWRGKNWLGEVLTAVRDEIISDKNYLF